MADLEWGRIVNVGGGFLLVALGAWVATRKPRQRVTMFAACAVGSAVKVQR